MTLSLGASHRLAFVDGRNPRPTTPALSGGRWIELFRRHKTRTDPVPVPTPRRGLNRRTGEVEWGRADEWRGHGSRGRTADPRGEAHLAAGERASGRARVLPRRGALRPAGGPRDQHPCGPPRHRAHDLLETAHGQDQPGDGPALHRLRRHAGGHRRVLRRGSALLQGTARDRRSGRGVAPLPPFGAQRSHHRYRRPRHRRRGALTGVDGLRERGPRRRRRHLRLRGRAPLPRRVRRD